ncbi:MAG: MFS transporter [Candidatus Hydrothermales bacterium]
MKRKISILLVACMSSFITPFLNSSINVVLPDMGKNLNLSAKTLSWIATSHLLSLSIFLLPFGKIGDIYGKRKIFLIGLLTHSLSSFFISISSIPSLIIFFRLIPGIGSAMIFGMGLSILTEIFSPSERGKAFGINSASIYTGLSLGPLLGGILTKEFVLRSLFIFNSIFSFITAIYLILTLEKNFKTFKNEKFDFSGFLIYAFSLIALVYGFSTIKYSYGILYFLIGVFGLILFINFENKIKAPLLEIDLFKKNPVFYFSNLATFINYTSTSGVNLLLSLYLQYIKGINPRETGIILLFQPIVMVLVSPFSGRISDKINPGLVASFGMFITFISLVLFTLLENSTKTSFILINLILLGLGIGIFAPPNINSVMSSVDRRFYSISASMIATMRVLGHLFSLAIVTFILSSFIGGKNISEINLNLLLKSIKVSFLLLTFLSLIGIFVSLKRKK